MEVGALEAGVLAGLELAGELELLAGSGLFCELEVCGVTGLFCESEVFWEPELFDGDPAGELANCQPEPTSGVPPPDDEAPVPMLAAVVCVCVAPGSTTATAPAASTLAKPAVAVAAFSRRLPRSRSATARVTRRPPARARRGVPRSSQLSMLAVCHIRLRGRAGFVLRGL